MISPQQLVLRWIEYAAAGAIMLFVAQLVISRMRQPADRIVVILLTLAVVAVVPILADFAPFPACRLGLFHLADRAEGSIASASLLVPGASDRAAVPEWHDQEPHAFLGQPQKLESIHEVQDLQRASQSHALDLWWLAAGGLLLSYCLVAAYFIVEWFVGTSRLRRIVTCGYPASSPVIGLWTQLTGGRARSVQVTISSAISVPLVYGWWRPTVVIPESLAAGDSVALRFCLLHEWAHIARGDLLAWHLTWLGQFVLWFQPQFWTLRRELHVCQDLLADYRATDGGRDGVEYSELLMELAQQQARVPLIGAMAFLDRSSQLSRRIRMVLCSQLNLRSRSRRGLCIAAGTVAFACAMILGVIRLDSAQVDGGTQVAGSGVKEKGHNSRSAQPPADTPTEVAPPPTVVKGKVIDPTSRLEMPSCGYHCGIDLVGSRTPRRTTLAGLI